MAEAIAGELLDEYGLPAVVISAGTLGISGRRPASSTRQVLSEIDIEPPSTRSQGLSPALLERADHIPVMEPRHARAVADAAREARDCVVRLWEYADEPLEGISDPVGEDLETFRETRDLLYQCVDRWFADLTDA